MRLSWSPDVAMQKLLVACKALGWTVLIPEVGDEDDVPGLIVGTREFTDEYVGTQEFHEWDTTEESDQ